MDDELLKVSNGSSVLLKDNTEGESIQKGVRPQRKGAYNYLQKWCREFFTIASHLSVRKVRRNIGGVLDCEKGKESLKLYQNFFMDCTLKIASKLFSQSKRYKRITAALTEKQTYILKLKD